MRPPLYRYQFLGRIYPLVAKIRDRETTGDIETPELKLHWYIYLFCMDQIPLGLGDHGIDSFIKYSGLRIRKTP